MLLVQLSDGLARSSALTCTLISLSAAEAQLIYIYMVYDRSNMILDARVHAYGMACAHCHANESTK